MPPSTAPPHSQFVSGSSVVVVFRLGAYGERSSDVRSLVLIRFADFAYRGLRDSHIVGGCDPHLCPAHAR